MSDIKQKTVYPKQLLFSPPLIAEGRGTQFSWSSDMFVRNKRMKGGGQEMYCTVESCGTGMQEIRRFLTKEEKVELLQEYKTYLEKEAKGVAERIAELEKEE